MVKKQITSLLVLIIMLILMLPSAHAASNEATNAANQLYELGLFNGTGTDANGNPIFDLDRAPTRHEAVTMLVRILGKADEAQAGAWGMPFSDVDDWAKPYVGYAYTNGLTTGTGANTFGGKGVVSATQYITFVLRALGYSSGADFRWDAAWDLSDKIGLTNGEYNEANNTDFTRGDVAIISTNALSVKIKGSKITLREKLGLNTSEMAPQFPPVTYSGAYYDFSPDVPDFGSLYGAEMTSFGYPQFEEDHTEIRYLYDANVLSIQKSNYEYVLTTAGFSKAGKDVYNNARNTIVVLSSNGISVFRDNDNDNLKGRKTLVSHPTILSVENVSDDIIYKGNHFYDTSISLGQELHSLSMQLWGWYRRECFWSHTYNFDAPSFEVAESACIDYASFLVANGYHFIGMKDSIADNNTDELLLFTPNYKYVLEVSSSYTSYDGYKHSVRISIIDGSIFTKNCGVYPGTSLPNYGVFADADGIKIGDSYGYFADHKAVNSVTASEEYAKLLTRFGYKPIDTYENNGKAQYVYSDGSTTVGFGIFTPYVGSDELYFIINVLET